MSAIRRVWARLVRSWRFGVVYAGLTTFGFGMWIGGLLPQFSGPDEGAHLSYTLTVLDGRLPEISTPVPLDSTFPDLKKSLGNRRADDPHSVVWVANHPPLYYVLTSPFVWSAEQLHIPLIGVGGMRLVNAAAMAFGVVLTGFFAYEILGRRPGPAVASALLVATMPNLIRNAGLGYNDGLAFALGAAALLVAARLVIRGATWRIVLVAAAVGSASALTRSQGVLVVPLLLGAFLIAARVRAWSFRRTVTPAAVLLFVPLALSGWFYARNDALYGSWTGSGYLLRYFGRIPRGSIVSVATDPFFYQDLATRLWAVLPGFAPVKLWAGTSVLQLVALPSVLALLAIAGLVRPHVRTKAWWRPVRRSSRPGVTALGWLVAAYAGAVIIAMATAVANGHLAHGRYAFAAVPPFIVAVVAGIERLTPNRWLFFGLLLAMLFIDWQVVVLHGGLPQPLSDGLSPVGAVIGITLATLAFIGALWSYLQVSRSHGSGYAHLDIDDGVFEARCQAARSTSDPKTANSSWRAARCSGCWVQIWARIG